MGEIMPSENEWIIMEVLWKTEESMTASEIIERLKGIKDVSPKTIRVLINRLLQKGMIDYIVDSKDSRVYHYHAIRDREECLREKSKRFINSYFEGNMFGMVTSLVQSGNFSDEQIKELLEILKGEKK